MVIEESDLKFEFDESISAIKFDDTEFYRQFFNKMPGSKGIDIIADSKNFLQFIEIKNCKGNETENVWRTSVDNRRASAVHGEIESKESYDVEVAKKVCSTIACLQGSRTKSEMTEKAKKLQIFWEGLNDARILKDKKKIYVILFLEGNFSENGPKSRSKQMIMKSLGDSISKKLSWLNCNVSVVDSDTYNQRLFRVS